MYSLRSTSKACRFECDALLFHSVKLQSHVYRNEDELRIDAMYGDVDLINLTDRKLEKATRGLVGCMLDGSGTITQHIQHLEICAIQQHLFETMIEPALKSLLLSHTNLQSLRYVSDSQLTSYFFLDLHGPAGMQTFQSLKISSTYFTRLILLLAFT
jgi:hypothetical protein